MYSATSFAKDASASDAVDSPTLHWSSTPSAPVQYVSWTMAALLFCLAVCPGLPFVLYFFWGSQNVFSCLFILLCILHRPPKFMLEYMFWVGQMNAETVYMKTCSATYVTTPYVWRAVDSQLNNDVPRGLVCSSSPPINWNLSLSS